MKDRDAAGDLQREGALLTYPRPIAGLASAVPAPLHIMVATPSYDGRLGFGYVTSREATAADFKMRGIQWSQFLIGGCSVIELARQEIVAAFMKSEATHLLMVDSDISWQPHDLLRMIDYDLPLVIGVAPKRLSEDFGVMFHEGETEETAQPDERGLIDVQAAGGAFCLIRRDCIERMQEFYPELRYRSVKGGEDKFALYLLELGDGGLFGEDYAFCRRARRAGIPVYVDPEVWLRHAHGSFFVEGALSDIMPNAKNRDGNRLADSIWSLPSRGRPKSMERFIKAYKMTLAECPIFVWLDSDDPELPAYEKIEYPAHWHVEKGPRFPNRCNGVIEEMFRRFPNASCYGLLADDIVPRTPRWDLRLANAAGRNRLAYGDDGFQHSALATHPVIGGDLARTIGWLILPEIRHQFADTALHTIAQGTGRLVYLPQVVLDHMHPLAGKAEEDATYQFRESWNEDHETFMRWSETGLPEIAKRVMTLPNY